jgi:hypothetical protein
MKPVRRASSLLLGVAAMMLVLAVVGPAATARRLASSNERTAVIADLAGRGYPPKCAVVYVSTVNQNWASDEWVGETGRRVPSGCQKYAANGITIAHIEHGHWRAVTAGSAFRCRIKSYAGQPAVPRRVANDLIPYLHC